MKVLLNLFPTQDCEASAQIWQSCADVTIVATGHMVWEAIEAGEALAEKGQVILGGSKPGHPDDPGG